MPDPFKARLVPANPLPRAEQPSDISSRGLNKSGEAMARDGYSVLERANRRDPFQENLRGIAPPVTNDQPNVAWDEEK